MDHGTVDITGLVAGLVTYGAIVIFVTYYVLVRKYDAARKQEIEERATAYIIREADEAIRQLFRGSKTFQEKGNGAWQAWYENYLKCVQTLCDSRTWIDRTCVGTLPLMENPAYAVSAETAHQIRLTLGNANLMGRPKVAA